MLRSFLCLFLCAVPLVMGATAQAQNAAAYAIADDNSGLVFESRNGTKKLQIGSLTKVATAMVVLDWAESKGRDLNQEATIPPSAEALGNAAGVGFHAGDRATLRDLLCAALMQSDNPAAQALADYVGRNLGTNTEPVTAFVAQMNALADKLQMTRTHFLNPHGGDTEKNPPYSTAEDLIKLTRYAEARAAFRFYVSQKEKKITILHEAGEPAAYMLRNTNELVGIDSIDGVKTGTTSRSGACLIISAARSPETKQDGEKVFITPRRVDVVVLNAGDRFAVAKQLLEKGWQFQERWTAAGRPAKWKPR